MICVRKRKRYVRLLLQSVRISQHRHHTVLTRQLLS